MLTVWRLRKGADVRVRSQHPWVFSNELTESPKGHTPGNPVLLQSHQGHFLAWGYGNPHSQIVFRPLSFLENDSEPWSGEALKKTLLKAWKARFQLGYARSFRLCFGEADMLPGLVVDRYLVRTSKGDFVQALVAQILTAGMEVLLKDASALLLSVAEQAHRLGYSSLGSDKTAILLRRDVSVRKLEGLEMLPTAVTPAASCADVDYAWCDTLVDSVDRQTDLVLTGDLVDGQKTGFFLDQSENIERLGFHLQRRPWNQIRAGKPVRILDLCSFAGQWSLKLAHHLKQNGVPVEVCLADVSSKALQQGELNLSRLGVPVHARLTDVMKDLANWEAQSFDVVIADPPAFVKGRKDLPQGQHAYMKLNEQALRLTAAGGVVASCSCSGLFTEEDFRQSLNKAIWRSRRSVQFITRGGHAADHPIRMSFPEGNYLKMFVHQLADDSI